MTTNPNNCKMCDHKKHPDGGHCYMFRVAPAEPCMQHTVRAIASRASIMQAFTQVMKMREQL